MVSEIHPQKVTLGKVNNGPLVSNSALDVLW